jgi:hypothetical protein
MTEHEKQRYQVYVKHPVYNELQLESAKQDKPISQLADQALVKYLQNAFLIKPGKPKKPRRSRPKRLKPYNWDKSDTLCLNKRIGIYDDVYRLLRQESQRTGKPIQHIATNAFIEYLNNINGKIHTVDMV